MGYRLFCLLLFVGMICVASPAAGPSRRSAASTPLPESHLYVYLNHDGGWCALKNRETFMSEVKSDNAAEFDTDEAQVWLSGARVDKVEEFRTDEDAEWTTISTYKLDEAGNVVSVRIVLRSGEPLADKTFNFTVTKGVYNPDVSSLFSPKAFRKAVSASSFPFLDLVKKLASDKAAQKLCS